MAECFCWYRPTPIWVFPDQRLLNGCVCVRACVCAAVRETRKIFLSPFIAKRRDKYLSCAVLVGAAVSGEGVDVVQTAAGPGRVSDVRLTSEHTAAADSLSGHHQSTTALHAPANTRHQRTYTHGHIHTRLNGPLSGTTRVSRYHRGKTSLDFTEAKRW